MKCEKCHRDRTSGDEYSFYYGTRGGSTTGYDLSRMAKVKTTSYNFAGRATAWICDGCVRRAQVLYLGLMAFLPIFVFFSARQVPGAETLCTAIGILLIIALPIIIFRAKQEVGDRLAISVRKPALKAQHFNAFIDNGTYNRMQRS